MSNSNCEIKVYDTSEALIYTLIKGNIVSCSVSTVTCGVGNFTFTLVGMVGHNYVFNDIGCNYRVKIYMGYDVLGAGDIQLEGKIQKITNDVSANGVLRTFEGKDLGEVLERRHKTNKRYQDIHASTITYDMAANDLGLGTDIEADTTHETITYRTEQYLEAFKRTSDFWFDGATRVQKDFWVNEGDALHPDGHFFWYARPIRTVGVETLVYGEDITNYSLTYDILPTKNKITVYGANTSFLPNDKDFWTEDGDDFTDNWSASSGTLSLDDGYLVPVEGTYGILCQHADTVGPPYVQHVHFQRTLPSLNVRDINNVSFYYYPGTTGPVYTTQRVRIYAPDAANSYYFDLTGAAMSWHYFSKPLGPGSEYDAVENPTGWQVTGSPNWWSLEVIEWQGDASTASGTLLFGVDKLYFSPWRWVGLAEDAGSQNDYELREAEYTDENLFSDVDCEKRANTLLCQLHEKVICVDLNLVGNTNVKKGDRIPLTLPPNNIVAIDFDVVSVSHSYGMNSLATTARCLYSGDKRILPPRTPAEAMQRQLENNRAVTSELYSRIVR